jgi:hypothetical protein
MRAKTVEEARIKQLIAKYNCWGWLDRPISLHAVQAINVRHLIRLLGDRYANN